MTTTETGGGDTRAAEYGRIITSLSDRCAALNELAAAWRGKAAALQQAIEETEGRLVEREDALNNARKEIACLKAGKTAKRGKPAARPT